MDTLFLHELKRQASCFFKDKIKAARMALLDVTPAQLLTEEATNGDSSVPDTRTMRVISRAAFEVDDYWRIVDILHKRLMKYDRQNWRAAYQALSLLEYLLTHGPKRVAEEFHNDQDNIKEMANFYYVDEKGFNWGLSVQNRAAKVLKLIENESFLKEERAREQKLMIGIKGFGSFCQRQTDENVKDVNPEKYLKCNSHFCDYQSTISDDERMPKQQGIHNRRRNLTSEKLAKDTDSHVSLEEKDDHPFCDEKHQHQALISLLSSR